MTEPSHGGRQLVLVGAALVLLAGAGWVVRQAACAQAVVGERFVIPYSPDRDLTREDRSFELEDLRVELSAGPRPLAPLKDLAFRMRVSDLQGHLTGLEPELAFNMDMDMGRFVYRLLPDERGYHTRVVLPVCVYGGHRWFLRIRFSHAGRAFEQVLLFDL